MTSPERATETSPESFRDVLAAALEITRVSPAELARRIGRSGAAVSQWLNRGDIPDLVIVFKIEDALELRIGTLVQHHSPDAWAILEANAGGDWNARTWLQKVQEGLIEGPFDNADRKMILDMIGRLSDYNISQNERGSP